MEPTDLEDLLKTKIVKFPPGAVLYLFILDMAQVLQDENPGSTISRIFASNPYWVDEEVTVLPSPLTQEAKNKLEIELDIDLKLDEIKIVYFNAYEVEDF